MPKEKDSDKLQGELDSQRTEIAELQRRIKNFVTKRKEQTESHSQAARKQPLREDAQTLRTQRLVTLADVQTAQNTLRGAELQKRLSDLRSRLAEIDAAIQRVEPGSKSTRRSE